MMRRRTISTFLPAAAGMLLLAAPAAAQQDADQWLRECERQAERSRRAVVCELRPSPLQLDARSLTVDAGPDGGVIVRGEAVDRVEVRIGVRAGAATEAEARALAAQVRISTSGGRLQAEGPQTNDATRWSVTYFATVPQRLDLDISTVNGPLSVRDVSGRIRARSTNGPVALAGLGGDVHARTTNGPLAVSLGGNRWEGEGLDAETSNGPVALTVPAGYSAVLETGTINGPLALGMPVTITTRGGRSSRIETTLGEGGPRVRAVTTNGPVTVTQRP